MRTYRYSMLAVLIFAVAYPLVSGSVLTLRWGSTIDEIYPITPWTLFCFTPNDEADYAVRLTAVDGQPLEPPTFFDDFVELTENERLAAYVLVQEMGRLAGETERSAFATARRVFERSFLRPLARQVRYDLVRREFDVLERWKTGRYENVGAIEEFVYENGGGGT